MTIIIILLTVAFFYWLFTSDSKVSDIKNTAKKINELSNDLENSLDDFHTRTHEYVEKQRVEMFYDTKNKLIEINKKRANVGLPEKTIFEFYEGNPNFADLLEKERVLEETERIRLIKNKLHLQQQEKIREREARLKLEFDLKEKKLIEEKEYLQQQEKILEKKAKLKLQLDLVLKEKLTTVNFDADRVEKIIADLDFSKIDQKLINYIYIRFYLTGKKDYIDLKLIKNHFKDFAPTINYDYYKNIWDGLINTMNLDDSKIKKIKGLYHFTHKENLPSILKEGILTRFYLDDKNISYVYNDEKRWDNVLDSISLSVSHPNHKMFYKYRNLTSYNEWVVLKISPELLSGNTNLSLTALEDFCYLEKGIFCKKNAASFAEKNRSIEERKSYLAFLDMFESPIGKTIESYTYDNQAEILYQGRIPKEFIEEICVIEKDESWSWVEDAGFLVTENKILFEKR